MQGMPNPIFREEANARTQSMEGLERAPRSSAILLLESWVSSEPPHSQGRF